MVCITRWLFAEEFQQLYKKCFVVVNDTRNSAVADKPRDAFVQYSVAQLTFSCVLPCQIWSFCIKGCRHKYRRTPKTDTDRQMDRQRDTGQQHTLRLCMRQW